MDSVDLEVQAIITAEVAKFSYFNPKDEPMRVGNAIRVIYDAIFKLCKEGNLSPGQARLVVPIVVAAFQYGKGIENYRRLFIGM